MGITNKMKIHGKSVQETLLVGKILRSMTLKFNYVVFLIEESNNVTTLSVKELQSILLVQEKRMWGR